MAAVLTRSTAFTITMPHGPGCRYEPFPVTYWDDDGVAHDGHEGWWCVAHPGECPDISWDGHVHEWWPDGPNRWRCSLSSCVRSYNSGDAGAPSVPEAGQ